jgi:hypothetical protein
VVSVFANDFAGDMKVVLEGRGGDWEEGKYWLDRIRQFCVAHGSLFLIVPAPWVNQLEGPQLAGFYPGQVSNALGTAGLEFLDPITDFGNALLAIALEGLKRGTPPSGNLLFNGRIGDGHFSPAGCQVWAEAVGRRLALLIEKRHVEQEQRAAPPRISRGKGAGSRREIVATRRSP